MQNSAPPPPNRMLVKVAVGLVFRGAELLIARRLIGSHQGGLWEFPGGKIEDLETPYEAVVRELAEETGVLVEPKAVRLVVSHEYPERSVEISFVDCEYLSGNAVARAASEVRWVPTKELSSYEFPAANHRLILDLLDEASRL